MMSGVAEKFLTLRAVPSHIIVLTAAASYGGLILAALAGWPLWALVLAALIPWGLVAGVELKWTYRHFGWLALFYTLVLTQTGHFIEHLTQMVQIHLLGLSGRDASGVFGRLDTEWVHFIWNTWVLVAVVALLFRYRDNRWLWLSLVAAGWHEIEHAYLIVHYISTGLEGNPGLLSSGGVIAGGLPFTRPDLHFFYNVVETVPLLVAFGWTLNRSYNEWVRKAFPHASQDVLIDATQGSEVVRAAAGHTLIEQGDPADAFYIIVRGQVEVTRSRPPATEPVVVSTLGPGEFFGETGLLTSAPRSATVRALTDVELLRLDRETFRRITSQSQATADDLARVMAKRQEGVTPAP